MSNTMYNKFLNPAPVRRPGELAPIARLARKARAATMAPARRYTVPASVAVRAVAVNGHWEKQTISTPAAPVTVSGTMYNSPAIMTAHGSYTYTYNAPVDGLPDCPAVTDLELCAGFLLRAKLRAFARDGFTQKFQPADIEDATAAGKEALLAAGYRDGFAAVPVESKRKDGSVSVVYVPPVWEDIKANSSAVRAALRAINNALRPRGMMTAEQKYSYYLAKLTRENGRTEKPASPEEIEKQAWKHATVPAETIPGSAPGIPCAYAVPLRDRLTSAINAAVRDNAAFAPFRKYALLSIAVGYIAIGTGKHDAAPVDGRKQPSMYRGIKRLIAAAVANIAANNSKAAPVRFD